MASRVAQPRGRLALRDEGQVVVAFPALGFRRTEHDESAAGFSQEQERRRSRSRAPRRLVLCHLETVKGTERAL